MKVTELLLEISKNARLAQRRAAADAKREAAAAARAAEEAALAAKIAKRTQKKIARATTPISATAPAAVQPSGGLFSDPELQKYMVNPSIDTSFSGGYYLQFGQVGKDVVAFWSRNPDLTLQQMQQFKQTQNLGSVFNAEQFENLLQRLIVASGTPQQPGYVNVILSKQQASDWALIDPKNFFRNVFMHLAREYPRDEYSADASVNWEIA